MQLSADLTLVHLSDIHFRHGEAGTAHDSDRELRQGVESDLRQLVACYGPVSGIIVTGDIAHSGHRSEYRYAQSWISRVTDLAGCSTKDVMVIPGNHDVDRREVARNDRRILKIQRRIRRGGDSAAVVARLRATLSRPAEAKLLIAPLKSYNHFARTFGCQITPSAPFWERRFRLGDGATVAVRGGTSTWLSGPDDSDKVAKLVYGSAQYVFDATNRIHRVFAIHHPPGAAIDGDEAIEALDFHCRLQLFGHKHRQYVTKTASCVTIAAGALQPDRRERSWTPRYNLLQFSGELVDRSHRLVLRVFPRRWSDEFRTFMPDFTPKAVEFREYQFVS